MPEKEVEIFYPNSVTAWRRWLEKNHHSKESVWVVFHRNGSGKKSISWSAAVDVALCFGWIDSKRIKINETTSHQYFSRRKPKSMWSKINKAKVKQLIENGLMTEAGYRSIEVAKENGSWTLMDEVEELVTPKELEAAFKKHKGSKKYFLGLSKSKRKQILQWIVLARRPETRQKRIDEISKLAGQQQLPTQVR